MGSKLKAQDGGFTLIELVVVLVIIFVLLGLILPATYSLRQASKRKHAALEAQTLIKAIKAYKNTYGKWPGQVQDDADPTHPDSALVVGALTTNTVLNPREINFIEVPLPSLVDGSFVDPWKHSYAVAFDENEDGTVDVNLGTIFGTGGVTNIPNETVAVISQGNDPENETKRIYSWVR